MERLHFLLSLMLLGTSAFVAPAQASPTALAASQPAYECFVSPTGSDKGSGTMLQPFATLERARVAVRAALATGGKGAAVTLRGGVYHMGESFRLSKADSGTADAPVIYRAAPGERPRLVGGADVSPSLFKLVTDPGLLERLPAEARGKVYQVDLKAAGIRDFGKMHTRGFRRPYVNPGLELFMDGSAMRISRWPNKGLVKVEAPVSDLAFQYSGNRPERWLKASDPWIYGFFGFKWSDDTVKLSSIDKDEKTITVANGSMWGMKETAEFSVLNLLEEIDEPGEYYLSRATGTLFVYPEAPLTADTEVQVSLLDKAMVWLDGASYVQFQGLTLEATRGIGVYEERGAGNLIAGCVLRNMGTVAVVMGQGVEADAEYRHPDAGTAPQGAMVSGELGSWHEAIYADTMLFRDAGTNNGVVGCDIYGIGAGAISLSGGDRRTLTPGGNYVENCTIHDYNRLDKTYKGAVNVDGVGNRVSHCELFDAPHFALYLHGNDHIVEYNNIHDVMLDTDDGGALYIGRDPSELGNTVRYNFWHDLGNPKLATSSVYLDDGACGTTITGNVFLRAGAWAIQIGGGRDNPVTNNIFAEMPLAINWDDRLTGWAANSLDPGGIFDIRLNAVNFSEPPYSERYPELAKYWNDNPEQPKRNDVANNLLYAVARTHNGNTRWGAWVKNMVTKQAPGFVDLPGLNLQLTDASPVYATIPGFNRIPFEQMGLYVDAWRQLLPAAIE